MFNTENLLRNEVFPAELPPCFSTDDLAANATLAIATSNSFGQGYSIPLTYSGYKSESSRRKFALPNPYHYCKAVDFIVKNESQIKAILEKSKYSLTAPIERQPRQKQPYAKRSNTVLDTKREIECLFQENRYEIFDITMKNTAPGIDYSAPRAAHILLPLLCALAFLFRFLCLFQFLRWIQRASIALAQIL